MEQLEQKQRLFRRNDFLASKRSKTLPDYQTETSDVFHHWMILPIKKRQITWVFKGKSKFLSLSESAIKIQTRLSQELTVRIAENVSDTQSDIVAWANPYAL